MSLRATSKLSIHGQLESLAKFILHAMPGSLVMNEVGSLTADLGSIEADVAWDLVGVPTEVKEYIILDGWDQPVEGVTKVNFLTPSLAGANISLGPRTPRDVWSLGDLVKSCSVYCKYFSGIDKPNPWKIHLGLSGSTLSVEFWW